MITANSMSDLKKLEQLEKEPYVEHIGPFRVRPGGLSVSRAFGDFDAKKNGPRGLDNVVVSDPEVMSMQIKAHDDFVLLACDGIFDTLSNEDAIQTVYDTLRFYKNNSEDAYKEYEMILGECVSNVMK